MDNIEVHYGRLIEDLVRQRNSDVDSEAERWDYERNNLYKIFRKQDVSTKILKKACLLYNVSMKYFLSGTNTVISQKGEQNVFGEANEIYYKSNSNVTGKVNDGDILLLKMENEGLRNQIEAMKSQIDTQRELIELLKSK